MKSNSKTLEMYFNKSFNTLEIPSSFLTSTKTLLKSSITNISTHFSTSTLKPLPREVFTKLRFNCLQKLDISQSFTQSSYEDIKEKFRKIKSLEKDIEKLQEKTEIIQLYEEYMAENRKPNLFYRDKSISYYKKEKLSSIEYLNSLVTQKQTFRSKAEAFSDEIQILYKEIEEDQEFLAKVHQKLDTLKTKPSASTKPVKKLLINSSLSGLAISENTEESKIDSKSKSVLPFRVFNPELTTPSDVKKKNDSHNSLNLKIKNANKPLMTEPRKYMNINIAASLMKSKSSKIDGDLSRSNLERLAMIEERLRHGEAVHGLITPTLERMKKKEKKAKEYLSLSPRIPEYSQVPESYQKLSPRFSNGSPYSITSLK